MMSRLIRIEREFASRVQADALFDCLRPSAWPYVWCTEIPATGRWKVTALIASTLLRVDNLSGVEHGVPEHRRCTRDAA